MALGMVAGCARVPMLISVRDFGLATDVGDMMVVGSPAGGRSMRCSILGGRPPVAGWRQRAFWSDRDASVNKGLVRNAVNRWVSDGRERLLAEVFESVVAALE